MNEKGTGYSRVSSILSGGAALVTIFGWGGITPESVGQQAYDVLFVVWPLVVAAFAFLAGWNIKKLTMERRNITAERIEELEKYEKLYKGERAQITDDLTCCDFPMMLTIAELYCNGFRMAECNLADANDPLWLAGIVTTGRVEVDGLVSYKIDLVPEKRSMYARHERFFLEEVQRIGGGRVFVDFDRPSVKLVPARSRK